MAYILNLFTPETWASFQRYGAKTSGFRHRQRRVARERIKPGDIFLCYLVRLSRWCGTLEITSEAFEDDTPIYGDPDPFTIRFHVKPLVLLEPERAIPIFEPEIWNNLSETRGCELGSKGWTGYFRSSLRIMDEADGEMLMSHIQRQSEEKREFPFTARDRRQLARKLTVRTTDREVCVEVPDDDDESADSPTVTEPITQIDVRQSIQIQGHL